MVVLVGEYDEARGRLEREQTRTDVGIRPDERRPGPARPAADPVRVDLTNEAVDHAEVSTSSTGPCSLGSSSMSVDTTPKRKSTLEFATKAIKLSADSMSRSCSSYMFAELSITQRMSTPSSRSFTEEASEKPLPTTA